jgi:hypothetical protein
MTQNWFTLDVESSGLHASSFPMQIAWCAASGEEQEFLIRPSEHWDSRFLDEQAVRLHGIALQEVTNSGINCCEAAKLLNRKLAGAVVLSDGISFDTYWTAMVFSAAKITQLFKLHDVYRWFGEKVKNERWAREKVLLAIRGHEDEKARSHNALSDARQLMRSTTRDFS